MPSTNEADALIARLLKEGVDYSPKRDEIISLFDDELYQGNWDSTVEFEDPAFRDLRLIQEDEYDQHRTGDMPDWNEQICYVSGHYVFYA